MKVINKLTATICTTGSEPFVIPTLALCEWKCGERRIRLSYVRNENVPEPFYIEEDKIDSGWKMIRAISHMDSRYSFCKAIHELILKESRNERPL